VKYMTKIATKTSNVAGVDRLLKPQRKNQIFMAAPSLSKTTGSSLIELLLAAVLALFAVSTAAQLISNLHNSGMNRRAAATNAIEAAINNDLTWFRQYALLWRLQRGPFKELLIEVSKTNYTQIPNPNINNLFNEYQTLPECATGTTAMATAFQNDAASLTTDFDSIKKTTNPVPNDQSETTIALPAVASDYKLVRKIYPGSMLGTLRITYYLSKSGSEILRKSSSLYLPASGWCP